MYIIAYLDATLATCSFSKTRVVVSPKGSMTHPAMSFFFFLIRFKILGIPSWGICFKSKQNVITLISHTTFALVSTLCLSFGDVTCWVLPIGQDCGCLFSPSIPQHLLALWRLARGLDVSDHFHSISLCPTTKAWSIFNNKVLPSSSAEQQREVAIANVLRIFRGLHDQQLLRSIPLGFLSDRLELALFTRAGYHCPIYIYECLCF